MGAHCEETSTGGPWTDIEAKKHINYMEIFAAFLGLKTYGHVKCNIHIRLLVDNTAVVNIINKMSS